MGPADGILTPDEQCSSVRVPTLLLSRAHSIVGEALWKLTVLRTHLHRPASAGQGWVHLPQSPMLWGWSWRPLSRVLDSEYFCPWAWARTGTWSPGIMGKALGVRQEEWHHPEAEVHHALFMLELTDVGTLVSAWGQQPCVNHAELFHVALNGWGHSHSLRFLCGPRGLLGP